MSRVLASFLTDFWDHQLVEHDRQGVFLVLVGFVGSFGFIRFSTRMMRSPRFEWWPGSVVSDSGVHLHHLVFGIWTMILGGTLGFLFFDVSPWWEISALLFGIGAGLTVDEFALWVHLDDVYWSAEGRSSVDAGVVAVAAMGLLLVGANPFEVEGGGAGLVITSVSAVVLVLVFVLICLAKGRMMHAVIGLFVGLVAIYGAARLAKPGSLWAKRRYGERNPGKQAKAEARFRPDRRTEKFKEWFRDAVGGTTEAEYQARLNARATQDEVLRRAEASEGAATGGSSPPSGVERES